MNEDDLDGEPCGPVLYEGKRFTGESVDELPDGTLISLTSYANGLQDGPDQEWYTDGSKRAEGLFRQGVPIGVHRTWDPDGRLVREIEFSDGGRILRRRGFDTAGNVTREDAG
ncbi:hypothetical protein LZ318_04500 [Saccharopolyspora indica]|uniref:toxin-antitoxin system YwqK family antitoxin n=1 Tax=Saccharopolyspora indica TaxID=1229659 RepID=UPI0022EB4908|nr:hypothetical protein [Saccharopolyspora indica]MDA3646477.1 hypothetical protein [Saccharopolyspora indica]